MNQQFYCSKKSVIYPTADFDAGTFSIIGIRLGGVTNGGLISIDMQKLEGETEAAFWTRAKSFISATIKESIGSTFFVSNFEVTHVDTDTHITCDNTGHEQNGERFFNGNVFLIVGTDSSEDDYFTFIPTLANTGNVISVNSYLGQQNAAILGFTE